MKIQFGNINRNNTYEIDTENTPIIIASIGISSDGESIQEEVEKAYMAKKYGAFGIIDHTLTRQYKELQLQLIEKLDLALCAIAVYEIVVEQRIGKKEFFDTSDVIEQFEKMAKRGVDLITVHASVMYNDLSMFYKQGRIIPSTSRGGTMIMKNMVKSKQENPYYEAFDELLHIAKEYNIGISLGSIYRPASVVDAVESNELYFMELNRNAKLVKRALEKNVAVMVEGYGHAPLQLIPELTRKSIDIILGVPFRVLTVATDSALGFDHVSSAIAVASATQYGANVVTAVTRAEHLGRPTIDNVKEAIISAKIGAHIGYSSRMMDFSLDKKMSNRRADKGCAGSIDFSIVPAMTKESLRNEKFKTKKCTMCGDYCALDSSDMVLKSSNND